MSKNYAGVEDLLSDESFLSWYFRTDIRAMQQWEQWIALNPHSRERVDQAFAFLHAVQLEEAGMSPGQITLAESRLLEKIRAAEKRTAGVRTINPRKWWMAAASVFVLALGFFAGRQLWSPRPSLHTTYGEIRDNRLPEPKGASTWSGPPLRMRSVVAGTCMSPSSHSTSGWSSGRPASGVTVGPDV